MNVAGSLLATSGFGLGISVLVVDDDEADNDDADNDDADKVDTDNNDADNNDDDDKFLRKVQTVAITAAARVAATKPDFT